MAKGILITCAEFRNALGAIRSLGRAGYHVMAAVTEKRLRPAGSISRYVSTVIPAPDALEQHFDFQEWLFEWHKKNPETLILPINEGAVAAAGTIRSRITCAKSFLIPKHEHLALTLSKFRATQTAQNAGLRTPPTAFLRAPLSEQLSRDSGPLKFPVIVKWDNYIDGTRYCKGGNVVAGNRRAFEDILTELEPACCAVIAQEIVPGYGTGAFLLRHAGKTQLRFAHRRLHEVPWTGGVSSLCESANDIEVLNAGERLLDVIDYEGVAMVEFRKSEMGSPVFLEINGRLWGSLGLALKAGADFPKAMVECHLQGCTSVPQPDTSRKIRWRNLPLELSHVRSVFNKPGGHGRLRPGRAGSLASLIWHSFARDTKSDLFWWRDPLPGFKAYWWIFRAEAARTKRRIFAWIRHGGRRQCLANCLSQSQKLLSGSRSRLPGKLLAVCYGNICQSPYAEARWNELRLTTANLPPCESAGFYPGTSRPTPPRFLAAARNQGVELRDHRSRLVDDEMVNAADWILLMDLGNWDDLRRVFPHAMGKALLLGACDDPHSPEILDPCDQPLPAGAMACRRIDSALAALASHLAMNGAIPARGTEELTPTGS